MKARGSVQVVLVVFLAILVLAFCYEASALINPKFTPIHLAAASDQIAIVTVARAEAENALTLKVVEALKGSNLFSKIICDLAVSEQEIGATRKSLEHQLGDALVFLAHSGTSSTSQVDLGILHAGTSWFRLKKGPAEHWSLTQRDSSLAATWAGGHESLLRVIRYVLSDASATVPSRIEGQWEEALHIAKVE